MEIGCERIERICGDRITRLPRQYEDGRVEAGSSPLIDNG